MLIEVVATTGSGPTASAAHQDALAWSGLSELNLVPFAGVIPSGTTITRVPVIEARASWGEQRLAMVADCRATQSGQSAWAGIGWCLDDQTGKGLCLAHTAHTEQDVELELIRGLEAAQAARGLQPRPIELAVIGAAHSGEVAACALVIACVSRQQRGPEEWPASRRAVATWS